MGETSDANSGMEKTFVLDWLKMKRVLIMLLPLEIEKLKICISPLLKIVLNAFKECKNIIVHK